MKRAYWVRFKDLSAYVTEVAEKDEEDTPEGWCLETVNVFKDGVTVDGDSAEEVYNEIMANKYSESFDEPNYNEE